MKKIEDSQILNIVGTQWGDEGKGKIVDILAEKFDIIARSGGGANAGHTIYAGGKKHIFHLIPSGILHEGKICIIGNGTVIHIPTILKELENLKKSGVRFEKRLLISRRAHLIFGYHIMADENSEKNLGKKKIGTTCRGIGPAYREKYARTGIRIGELENFEKFKEKLEKNAKFWEKNYGFKFDTEKEISYYKGIKKEVLPLLSNTEEYLWEEIEKKKKILIEGAQGNHLDIDFGTYPFVTSSNTISAGALSGTGIPPKKIDHIIGIVKAYTTRVGAGIFPSELLDEDGEKLRDNGHEYGATTGRPRRCGWLDIPVLKRAINLSGIDSINLTKLDVLSGFKKIKVVKNYIYQGKKISSFPSNDQVLENSELEIIELDGWDKDISKSRKFEDLPGNAKKYVSWIEDETKLPIKFIGVGPGREDMISR